MIKRCLDEADSCEVFGDICEKRERGHRWITIFGEHKEENEEFQPISDNTIIVFCKLLEPDDNYVTYIGHLLVNKTISCSELLTRIAEMAKLPNETEYSAFTEEGRFGIREIAEMQRSVVEVW